MKTTKFVTIKAIEDYKGRTTKKKELALKVENKSDIRDAH